MLQAFPHPDHVHAGLSDVGKVGVPPGFRPLLRVVDDPVKERIVGIAFVHGQNFTALEFQQALYEFIVLETLRPLLLRRFD